MISPTECPARAPHAVGAEGAQGEQAGADEQRLGDGGVLDRLLVRGRAVGDEVDPGGVGEGGEVLTGTGQLEPRGEEARGLRALAGADDDDHVSQRAAWPGRGS